MARPDLNLLYTLDVLLAEGSVAGAARRLRLSPSAMSRALARLRETTGDPLLVRAGRGLVPSPRALMLREQVHALVQGAEAALRPSRGLVLRRLQRRFTLRTRDGFVESFGAPLLARVARDAPGVQLCFVNKPDRDSAPLREGEVDLETGVVGPASGPELRTQALFRERFIGVAAPGHPLLAGAMGGMEVADFASARHVWVTRRGQAQGPVDRALAGLGLRRQAAAEAESFAAALALVRHAGLIAVVPERHTAGLRAGLHGFELPVPLEPFTVSLLWHPRMEGDEAHRWLRGCVRAACEEAGTPGPASGLLEPVLLQHRQAGG